MGIKELWNILDSVKQETSLASFRGKTLAIDFGVWFVECNTTQFVNRALFSRVLDLMSHGITPVFVLDSVTAPGIKARKRGNHYFQLVRPWEELFIAMGFKVIRAPGEAERTCAYLNHLKIVDGCITNDGDCLAYGATTVLKGYGAKSKEMFLYEAFEIKKELDIGQEELIAAALLIGSDYCPGVKDVGKKAFVDLIQEFKRNGVSHILNRILSWAKGSHISSLKQIEDDFKKCKKERRKSHCPKCRHLGTLAVHEKNGCEPCSISIGCQSRDKDETEVCSCHLHQLENKIKPFLNELKVAESSSKTPDFSQKSESVIEEFRRAHQNLIDVDVAMKNPDFPKFKVLAEKLSLLDMKNYFIALIKMSLYGLTPPEIKAEPIEIIQKCLKNGEECYIMDFKMPDYDYFSATTGEEETRSYKEVCVLQNVIDGKFPHMELKKEETTTPDTENKKSNKKGRKRAKEEEPGLVKITKFFKVTKRLKTERKVLA